MYKTYLASLFGIALAFSQARSEASLVTRQKTFDAVWKTVNDKYFDKTFGGVNWNEVRERYAPRVATIKNDKEFSEVLDTMLREIRISHLRILDLGSLDKQMARSPVVIGMALRDIDGQVVVTRIFEGSPADKAGIRTGFVIKTIDGVATANAREAETKLASEAQKHKVTFLDGADLTKEAALEHQLPPADRIEKTPLLSGSRYSLWESRRMPNGMGYIHFTNFIAPITKRLTAAFETLADTPGMIIDLRGNSGGDEEVGMSLAGALFGKPVQLAVTRTRSGDDNYYKSKPHKKAYTGRVVILIDEASASESEQVAATLKDLGRATVIGRKSRGEVMAATFQELPMDSIALLYPVGQPRTVTGLVIEGNGATPAIEVKLTRAELLKGIDAQLEAAKAFLQSK
jgi:carboxyl-terminal processing protease